MATHPRVAATPTHPVDIHQRQEASLLRQVATLMRQAATPQRQAATPQRRVATPQRRAATLQRRAVTPQQQAVTPQQQAATLLAVTLPQREASPLREGTSLSLVSAVIPPCILSQVTLAKILISIQFSSIQTSLFCPRRGRHLTSQRKCARVAAVLVHRLVKCPSKH